MEAKWPWIWIAHALAEAGIWRGFSVPSLRATIGGSHAVYPYCHYDGASIDLPYDRRAARVCRAAGLDIYEEPDSLTKKGHTHLTVRNRGTAPRDFLWMKGTAPSVMPRYLHDYDPAWAIYEEPPFGLGPKLDFGWVAAANME